jgi:hypothetical protein
VVAEGVCTAMSTVRCTSGTHCSITVWLLLCTMLLHRNHMQQKICYLRAYLMTKQVIRVLQKLGPVEARSVAPWLALLLT